MKGWIERVRAGRGLWRNDHGAAAVEFAFVTPVLILVLAGIIQFGLVLFLQNHMSHVARETSRRVAVGELTTQTAAQQYATDSLIDWGSLSYTVAVSMPGDDPANEDDVNVQISAPMSDAAIVDILGVFQGGTLQAAVTMREE